MRKQANIPIYVKLTSQEHLGIKAAREWYRLILRILPSGLPSYISSMDNQGNIEETRLVRRNIDNGTELIVPLNRDLVPTELQALADAWREISPPGQYSISTNPTQDQKLNQAVNGLKIEQDEYQSLCLQLAKVQHEGWMREKSKQGWSYGPVLSISNKTHPMMRPWDDLPAQYKDVDTNNPENFLNFLNNQGYAVVRQEELGALLKVLRDIK